jgi:hypothetical protein
MYEHSACTGRSNPTVPTVTGATTLVSIPLSAGSDGYLVRLSNTNTSWYTSNGVYFNGWDRRNVGATSGVGIHHPNGDIMKISTYNTTLTSATITISGQTMASNSSWRVLWAQTVTNWGVTEGGSSGSPLFNQDKRIVGTLTGGSSSCSTPTYNDYYGKLYWHWEQHATQKMKPYLDPINSGAEFINGTYTAGVTYTVVYNTPSNGTLTVTNNATGAPVIVGTVGLERPEQAECSYIK